jgi:hypothetical protein
LSSFLTQTKKAAISQAKIRIRKQNAPNNLIDIEKLRVGAKKATKTNSTIAHPNRRLIAYPRLKLLLAESPAIAAPPPPTHFYSVGRFVQYIEVHILGIPARFRDGLTGSVRCEFKALASYQRAIARRLGL